MFNTSEIKHVVKGWGSESWLHNDAKYCGKILSFDEGKQCSLHYHKLKYETFYLESGMLLCRFFPLEMLAEEMQNQNPIWELMLPGDTKEVEPGLVHQMKAVSGPARLLEFSTEHFDADSYRIVKGD